MLNEFNGFCDTHVAEPVAGTRGSLELLVVFFDRDLASFRLAEPTRSGRGTGWSGCPGPP